MGQLVVRGHVLTVDDDRRVLADGAVYVNDGRIEAVADASAPPPAGYKRVPRIRVGLVAPGLIDTDMLSNRPKDELAKLQPFGRLGRAAEVAEAIVSLLDAEWTTGAIHVIDGGLTAGMME